jgi:hypothetical protein
MPILSTCTYLQQLLDGLAMPGENTPAMASYVDPPDPNEETDIPTAYVWPTNGDESRDPKNSGSMPRNSGPGTFSGDKPMVHAVDIFIIWMGSADDDATGAIWLGIIDAVMAALRTANPMPYMIMDPWTQAESQIADVGEVMNYKTVLSALEDQAYNRYDALIRLPVTEVISA